MDRVLLIENSGLTFRCDSVPSAIKESTDKTGMMILNGVPATILDKENGSGRRYTKREIQRSIRRARNAGLFEQKRLLCTADDHPEESFPAPINASHVVVDAYTKKIGNDTILLNDWLVFNTIKGKDLQGLVEGGASCGTSIREWGQYNEDTNLTMSETRKLWMTIGSTLKRVVLGEMGHARGPTGAEPIALDIL